MLKIVNLHLRFFRRELLHELFFAIPIVWTIAGVNTPTWYNATHYYVNSSCNSPRLENYKCELTVTENRADYFIRFVNDTFRRQVLYPFI